MMRALQAVVFDFDGVIADSERLHLRAYQDVLGAATLTLPDEAYFAEYLGYDDFGFFRIYNRNHDLGWDEETIERLMAAKSQRYDDLTAQGEMLFPGSAAFIRDTARAVPIAIASGARTREIEEVLEKAGLGRLFTAIVGADQTERSKPSPDPYLEAIHRIAASGLAVDPARTVAIEDSRWGLVSAATAGLRPVAVTNTYGADELAPYAELIVPGLHALTLDALDDLCASPKALQRSGGTAAL